MEKQQLIINFNNENYIANYNSQTGYYEIDLSAPKVGGIYNASISFTDLIGKIKYVLLFCLGISIIAGSLYLGIE